MTASGKHTLAGGRSRAALVLLFLTAIVMMNLILPLMMLLAESVDYEPFYSGFVKLLTNKSTLLALWNSFKVTLTASMIAIAAAFFFAYIVEFKLGRGLRQFFRFAAIIPMLVPSITHGIVIVYLLGKMGIVTRLIGVEVPIYGPLGIILGSFFYAFPTAFLLMSQAFINLDGRLFEQAEVMGVGVFRRFFEITLPIMKYAVFSAFAVCFTMIFTDYGVPISVGGTYTILPVLFYKNVIGMLDFGKGAIYSTLILLPAAAVYLLDLLYFSKKQLASRHHASKVKSGPFAPLQKLFFVLLTVVILVPVLIIAAAPFIENWPYDLTFTLRHFERIFSIGAMGQLIVNSVVIALCTGVVGTILAFLTGYMYVRDKHEVGILKKVTHGMYMVSLAVPGLALGLGFAIFFRGSFLYNTMLILVIVNIIHFFGSPYMMVISHFKLLNPGLEATCYTLGGNIFNVIFDIIIPNSKKMLYDVFVYFFTNSMITISAVSLLYTSNTRTLAVQITAYNDQGTWESAIAVSLIILVINMAVKLRQSFRKEDAFKALTVGETEEETG